MATRFVAKAASADAIGELEALDSANPFATAEYLESRRQLGYAAWLLGLDSQTGTTEVRCAAFLKTGRIRRILYIPSLPSAGSIAAFWDGLRAFCMVHQVTELELDTFNSPDGTTIGDLGKRLSLRSRSEYVLDLECFSIDRLSSNHRRNLRKAERAGAQLRISHSLEALESHRSLQSDSMLRRRSRGESLSPKQTSEEDAAILRAGAGQLFQAMIDGRIVSSVLVLRARTGGYYHSAGTSPQGMTLGASHFLITGIARHLADAGCSRFNLGGADPQSSLARFKQGFGTACAQSAAGRCEIAPFWIQAIVRLSALARRLLGPVSRVLVPSVSRMLVFVADAQRDDVMHLPDGVSIRPLAADEMGSLPGVEPDFRLRQLQRLDRFGASYAYGVFVGERLAHVSWLLPPAAMEKDEPRVLRGRQHEAEITCCETVMQFRGQGLYPLAIRSLLAIAGRHGVNRIYMKTSTDNLASQSGIRKAGLVSGGSVILVRFHWRRHPLVLRSTA